MAREAPLVSQYLERISRDAVEKYQFLFKRYVRHRQGVNALYKRKRLYWRIFRQKILNGNFYLGTNTAVRQPEDRQVKAEKGAQIVEYVVTLEGKQARLVARVKS